MNISDHEIQAYVDGELRPGDAARIDAAIAADVMVAARVEREKRRRAALRGAYDPSVSELAPDPLRMLLAGDDATSSGDARADGGNRSEVRPRSAGVASRWRAPVLVLAASVAALAVSTWLRPGAPMRVQDGYLVARGELARDLDSALASAPAADPATSIGLTFRAVDGRICRSFAHRGMATAGLACRDGDRWILPIVSRLETGEGAVRQASSTMPAEVQAAVDARLQGVVFDAAQERAAREAGWR